MIRLLLRRSMRGFRSRPKSDSLGVWQIDSKLNLGTSGKLSACELMGVACPDGY